jgi:long-chain acyl-CoA synthetase
LYGAPFHHAQLAAEPSGLPWPTLRLAVSTAASLQAATAQAFQKRFAVPLSQALGIIEVGLPLLNVDAPDDKPESVGKPQPDFAAELRDESGQPVAVNAVGELLIRGPGMFDAYLSPWRLREDVLVDGWFCTGDLAVCDCDGDLTVVGRTHSVINVAGMKCFPEEIETVLGGHPDVKSARVVGRSHPKFGAVPFAEVVARDPANPPSVSSILAHCRNALARYKIPVDFHFVESLPRTASGKIRRFVE